MTPNEEAPPSPERQTAAENMVLRSADDTGRIPFPEGSYREIASFLEAITRLEKRGFVEHRMDNGHFGCYLTETGKVLQSDLVETPPGSDGKSSHQAVEQSHHITRASVALLLGFLLLDIAPSVETPDRHLQKSSQRNTDY